MVKELPSKEEILRKYYKTQGEIILPSKDTMLKVYQNKTQDNNVTLPSKEEMLSKLRYPQTIQLQERLIKTQPRDQVILETQKDINIANTIINNITSQQVNETPLTLVDKMKQSPVLTIQTLGKIADSPIGKLVAKGLKMSGASYRIPLAFLDWSEEALVTKGNPSIPLSEALKSALKGEGESEYGAMTPFKFVARAKQNISLLQGKQDKYLPFKDWNEETARELDNKPVSKVLYNIGDIGSDIVAGVLSSFAFGRGIKAVSRYVTPVNRFKFSQRVIDNAMESIKVDDEALKVAQDEAKKVVSLRQQYDELVKKYKTYNDTMEGYRSNYELRKGLKKSLRDEGLTADAKTGITDQINNLNIDIKINKAKLDQTKSEILSELPNLAKQADDLLKAIHDEATLRKSISDELAKSLTLKDDIALRQKKVLDEVYDSLRREKNISRDISEIKDISTIIEKRTFPYTIDYNLSRINDGIKLLDDYKAFTQDLIKRQILIDDIKNMIKPSRRVMKRLEEEGIPLLPTAKLNGKMVRNVIKSMTHGETDNLSGMMLTDLENLRDMLVSGVNLPDNMNILFRSLNYFTPDWLAFKRIGVPFLHSTVESELVRITKATNELDNYVSTFKSEWRQLFGKRWGKDESEMLAYIANTGERIPADAPQELVAKFSSEQLDKLVAIREGYKKRFDELAEIAIKEGKMLPDDTQIKNLNNLLDSMQNKLKSLDKTDPEYNKVYRDIQKVKKRIKDLPPVYIKNYYPHKILADNIMAEANKVPSYIEAMNRDAWFKELMKGYSVRAFEKSIPSKITATEFLKRVKDNKAFSLDAIEVFRMAFRSEMRKLFLEPVLEQGAYFIKSLPPSERKDVIGKMFRRFALMARGMEAKGDKTTNELFSALSKAVGKVVNETPIRNLPKVAGINKELVWRSRERAFDNFTGILRKAYLRGTLSANIRVLTKNLFQVMHSISTLGSKSTWAGIESMFSADGRAILKNFDVMIGRMPLESFNITDLSTFDRIGLLPNQAVEFYINCASAGNGAIWKLMTSSTARMQELAKYAIRKGYDPASIQGFQFWRIMREAIEDGLFKDVVYWATQNIKFTQFAYNKWDLPASLTSSMGKTILMYSNWWQHFWTAYIPALFKMLIKGETPYGMKLGWTKLQRYSVLGYASMMAGIAYVGSKLGFNMGWMFPTTTGKLGGYSFAVPVSPPVATGTDIAFTLGGLVDGAMSGNNEGYNQALKRLIEYDLPTVIPAGAMWRASMQVAEEKKPARSLILQAKPVKPIKARPIRQGRAGRHIRHLR